ncbi:hypothetical protein [Nocardiopsis kunsanensis]|uniref:Uncharacterized protein n=1 Tax=Nocardiopsis kunsanensis TaxID=141693 RepID=A0A918XKZ8_9ACTN|nr:hypothetical protein [Nocardiopsis kunsanensis]GHD35881.1 hypothetical protein GCM10007147_42690 [Nocardiopsis kunsanensis]
MSATGVLEPTGPNRSLSAGTCPDPLHARTPAEFTRTMRSFLTRIGGLSYQELEYRSGGTVSARAFRGALESDHLPRYVMLLAFVTACVGANEPVCQRWIAAWRALRHETDGRFFAG